MSCVTRPNLVTMVDVGHMLRCFVEDLSGVALQRFCNVLIGRLVPRSWRVLLNAVPRLSRLDVLMLMGSAHETGSRI